MVKVYKVNQSSRWNYFYKILLQTLSLTIVTLIVYKYYRKISEIDWYIYVLGGLVPWFLIFGLPLVLLYFNHRKHSKNVIFEESKDFLHMSMIIPHYSLL